MRLQRHCTIAAHLYCSSACWQTGAWNQERLLADRSLEPGALVGRQEPGIRSACWQTGAWNQVVVTRTVAMASPTSAATCQV